MANEIAVIENPLDIINIDKDVLKNMQSFQKSFLHKEPDPKELQTNEFANDSKYLPISFMQMTLDEIFFGLWQTKNFQTQGIANEIVGSVELHYFHPVAKTWLCRIGAAAVQIQYEAEYEMIDGKKKKLKTNITDISKKITNTLTKDYPHLYAECLRNACLSLGKTFGRDLNRKHNDQYKPVIKEVAKPTIDQKIIALISLIDKLPELEQTLYQRELASKRSKNELTLEYLELTIAKVKAVK